MPRSRFPLSHRQRRNDMISEVGGGLRHVATVAGGAGDALLAGERHDESCAAAHEQSTGESKAEDAALEIAAKLLVDVTWNGPLGAIPSLEVLRDDSVEQRLFGAAPLVAAERRRAAVRVESGPCRKPYDCGNHGRTEGQTEELNIHTLPARRSRLSPGPASRAQRATPLSDLRWSKESLTSAGSSDSSIPSGMIEIDMKSAWAT